ncbi:hypothetical protein [Gallibacterium sp. AGMB14963]|uniref:hypothetical protein n=1 Tax=Gallibacterium faecale TaxID=3019086 RepID=UPI0022F1B75B|nr:hypothetical protein [Gallibacterium sp. AGMB14963]MDA3978483.1 hypothetical protein [Gallibacterium sp. AGMB14963]
MAKRTNKTPDAVNDEVMQEDINQTEENTVDNASTKEIEKDGQDAINSNVFEPVAIEVLLRANHPQESYGRIGRRFNKDTPVVIELKDLSGEDVFALEQDVWLETRYIG